MSKKEDLGQTIKDTIEKKREKKEKGDNIVDVTNSGQGNINVVINQIDDSTITNLEHDCLDARKVVEYDEKIEKILKAEIVAKEKVIKAQADEIKILKTEINK